MTRCSQIRFGVAHLSALDVPERRRPPSSAAPPSRGRYQATRNRLDPNSGYGIVSEMDRRPEPGLDDVFEEAIDEALGSLPADLRAALSNVAVLVEDEPPDGQLLGLYYGVPLSQRTFWTSGIFPARVSIFRGPITRLAAGDADRLRREVRQVVLHELAHYFEIV